MSDLTEAVKAMFNNPAGRREWAAMLARFLEEKPVSYHPIGPMHGHTAGYGRHPKRSRGRRQARRCRLCGRRAVPPQAADSVRQESKKPSYVCRDVDACEARVLRKLSDAVPAADGTVDCPVCRGTTKIGTFACSTCRGRGRLSAGAAAYVEMSEHGPSPF